MKRKLFLPAYFLMNTGKVLELSFKNRMSIVGLNVFIGLVTGINLISDLLFPPPEQEEIMQIARDA